VATSKEADTTTPAKLTMTFTDPGTLDPHHVDVNWGDGSAHQVFNLGAGALTFEATHTYLDDPTSKMGPGFGNYPVTAVLTDDDGGSNQWTVNARVNNVPPTLSNLSATSIDENQQTYLTGTISDVSPLDTFKMKVNWGDQGSFIWDNFDYGPGGTVINFMVEHKYLDDRPGSTPDDYTVTAQVKDDNMSPTADLPWITKTTLAHVSNVAPSNASAAFGQSSVEQGTSVGFSGSFADPGTLDRQISNINRHEYSLAA